MGYELFREIQYRICALAIVTFYVVKRFLSAVSAEEAGQYLEAYKIYEHKAVEAIMERQETNLIGQVTLSVQGVSGSDVCVIDSFIIV